jgi:hypothetical protein
MNTEGDLREGERVLQSSWHLPLEKQSKRLSQENNFPDHKEGMEQDRNMEYASANQPFLEDLDPQKIEEDDDPELADIAAHLRETASYAINPSFIGELRKNIFQQFLAHHAVETKPIQGMDEFLCPQLPTVATDMAKLPSRERNALLSDLGNRLPIAEKRKLLEQAFQEEALQLYNSAPHAYENDFEHNILLCRVYRYIIDLLKRLHGPSRKNHYLSRHGSNELDSSWQSE